MPALTYRYRLYPTSAQEEKMYGWLQSLRWLYNTALAQRRAAWRLERRSINVNQQCAALPRLKKRKPDLAAVHSQVLQNAVFRVDKAFVAFFRRTSEGPYKPGYPRYKSQNRYRSFTYPQATAFRILDNQNRIRLGKLGNIKLRYHRLLEGVPKTATVIRYPSGKWYVCICCEMPRVQINNATSTGFDLGLSNYLVSSEGAVTKPLRALRQSEKKLRREQRKLSRKKKGSKRHCKQLKRHARVHEHVANQRADFLHKTSRRVVDSHQGFAFEELRIKNMLKNHRVAKAISDAGWAKFISMVAYKAARAGKPFVLIDARGTSQSCSRCRMPVAKDLSVRTHDCPACGLVMDRDLNAAINIAGRVGTTRSYARGETPSVDRSLHPQAVSVKRETPSTETG